MIDNILIVGGTSEIAVVVAKNFQESGNNVYSISRKNLKIKFYKDSLKINFNKKIFKKKLLNSFFSKLNSDVLLVAVCPNAVIEIKAIKRIKICCFICFKFVIVCYLFIPVYLCFFNANSLFFIPHFFHLQTII